MIWTIKKDKISLSSPVKYFLSVSTISPLDRENFKFFHPKFSYNSPCLIESLPKAPYPPRLPTVLYTPLYNAMYYNILSKSKSDFFKNKFFGFQDKVTLYLTKITVKTNENEVSFACEVVMLGTTCTNKN